VDGDASLSAVASLIADQHRSEMMLVLLGGGPQSGTALADAAGISRSLASAHLRKLVAGGLVQVKASGRQRMYTIASHLVADALEALLLLSPPSEVRSLRQAARSKNLRWARMCYDHLAGVAGVAVTRALAAHELISERDGTFMLTPQGSAGFAAFGIDIGDLRKRRRPLLRECMDWTEQRHHLAGSIGAALAAEMLRRDWLRSQETSRIVTVTAAGHAGLRNWLGIDLAQLQAAQERRG
jgi:DNA-binding transcriptional ArsR family regulator